MRNRVKHRIIVEWVHWRVRNIPHSPTGYWKSLRLLHKYCDKYASMWRKVKKEYPESHTSQDFRAFIYIREINRLMGQNENTIH